MTVSVLPAFLRSRIATSIGSDSSTGSSRSLMAEFLGPDLAGVDWLLLLDGPLLVFEPVKVDGLDGVTFSVFGMSRVISVSLPATFSFKGVGTNTFYFFASASFI